MRLGLFLLAESLSNLGLYVFFLLFNLYLLDRGFDEAFLGVLRSLQTAGSLCATLPAGWFSARYGVGAALWVAFAGGAGLAAAQAAAGSRASLAVLAFIAGLALSFRAVSISPAIAQLSNERTRARTFSVFFALSIGLGVVGGVVGGKLPGWVSRFGVTRAVEAKQISLWIGCGVSALSLIPLVWLKLDRPETQAQPKPVYPWTPFVRRFLISAAVWNLFTAAFPPFFNAYLARRYAAPPDQIGLAFSGSQLAQVGAMLLAPVLYARAGLVRGIPITQAASAVLLALVAGSNGLASAAVLYAAYTALQWMSEPGWHTLLMNGVKREEQSGASSLNFAVGFAANGIAAALFGFGVTRAGYSPMVMGAAAVGLCAALLFWWLLRGVS